MAEPAEREMFPKEKLELALKAREQFLKEQPHLQSLQDEIDRILENTVGFENRMSVLLFMIEAKLCDLRESIANLLSSFKTEELFNEAKVENADRILDSYTNPNGYLN